MSEFQIPRRGAITALALCGSMLSLMLGGCSSLPSVSMPALPSWFTSNSPAANANASAVLALPPNFECPSVQVRTGAATLTSSANPAEPTAMNLKYQVTIGTTARECRMGPGNTVLLKVGMQGRVILGPEGNGTTSINVPLRFAVVHEMLDSKVITTKLDRIAVAVPPGDGSVLFSHVTEGLDFPMPRGADIDSYVIYIGFDAAGLEPEKKPAPKAKPARKRPATG